MDDGLPVTALEAWLRECTGARSVAVQRRPGGGRHQAWDVTLAAADGATDRPVPPRRRPPSRPARVVHAVARGRDLRRARGRGPPGARHPRGAPRPSGRAHGLRAPARRASAASSRTRRSPSSTSWSTRWCACTGSTSRRSRCRRSSPRGASPTTCATSSTCGRAASTRAAGRSPSCARCFAWLRGARPRRRRPAVAGAGRHRPGQLPPRRRAPHRAARLRARPPGRPDGGPGVDRHPQRAGAGARLRRAARRVRTRRRRDRPGPDPLPLRVRRAAHRGARHRARRARPVRRRRRRQRPHLRHAAHPAHRRGTRRRHRDPRSPPAARRPDRRQRGHPVLRRGARAAAHRRGPRDRRPVRVATGQEHRARAQVPARGRAGGRGARGRPSSTSSNASWGVDRRRSATAAAGSRRRWSPGASTRSACCRTPGRACSGSNDCAPVRWACSPPVTFPTSRTAEYAPGR